jgi:hypothetical protein
MKSIGTALKEYLDRRRLNSELDVARVWLNWPDIVGSHLAEMARPLGRRGTSLRIGVEDSIVMQELTYFGQDILDRIEEFLGWQPFDKVALELLQDRTSLDRIALPAGPSRRAVRAPEEVGQLGEDSLPSGSTIASCYRSYLDCILGRKK